MRSYVCVSGFRNVGFSENSAYVLNGWFLITCVFIVNFSAWKVSVFGVFLVRIWSVSGPYFYAFELTMEIYSVNLRIQSECGKTRTKKTLNKDNFYAVCCKLWTFFLGSAEGSNEISSVRPSVYNTVFSRLTHYWDICGPQIKSFTVFSKSADKVFLNLYRMASIKKWLKMAADFFSGKFIFC